jgi:hypothetical protein
MVTENILETTEVGKRMGSGLSGIKKEMKKLMVSIRMMSRGKDNLKIIFTVLVKLRRSMLYIITMDKKRLQAHS